MYIYIYDHVCSMHTYTHIMFRYHKCAYIHILVRLQQHVVYVYIYKFMGSSYICMYISYIYMHIYIIRMYIYIIMCIYTDLCELSKVLIPCMHTYVYIAVCVCIVCEYTNIQHM